MGHPYGLKEASVEMMADFEAFVTQLVSYLREIGEDDQADIIASEIPRYEREVADLCAWMRCRSVERLKKRP